MRYAPTVEELPLHGWDGLRLRNGLIEALCAPEIGGRMMQFSLGPQNYLFMNPELLGKRFTAEEHAGDGTILHWKNYGGDKTWPAPQGWDGQGQWAGPPDPILDSGQYACQTQQNDEAASVSMTSPPDHRSGLQIRRRISLAADSSRLRLDLTFKNISRRTIRWAIWDVAQLACDAPDDKLNDDCWLYIPIARDREKPYEVMFGDDNPQYHLDSERGMLAVRYQGAVGKIGVHSPAGWIAFANQQTGFALCMQFPYQPDADYPDNGATVECWTESPGAPSPIPIRSPGHIMEAEILSPLHTLRPGDIAQQTLTWSAAYCPGPIAAVTNAGCVHRPLTTTVSDGWARINGVFGSFFAGGARLDILDGVGEILHHIDLGTTSPTRVLHVDALAKIMDGASVMRLCILNADGSRAGDLDRVALDNPE